MGICYTYLLYDEWDWRYDWAMDGLTKEDVIKHIKIDFPVAEVLAQWRCFIVIDMDKISPYGDIIQRLKGRCEKCYYYDDMGGLHLEELHFKPTKQEIIEEENKPANRNAVFIEQANKEWTERFQMMNTGITYL